MLVIIGGICAINTLEELNLLYGKNGSITGELGKLYNLLELLLAKEKKNANKVGKIVCVWYS